MYNKIKELYTDGKRWYDCPSCKGKGKLGISEKDNYLIYHCFKCSDKGKVRRSWFKSSHKRVDANMVGRHSEVISLPSTVKRIPSTFKLSVLGYLLKYGITNNDIIRCKVYSDNDNIIFPVYDGMWLVKYQQRNVLTKWIETHSKRGYTGKAWLLDVEEDKRLILVEDGVSAIKVSRHFPVLCLFGTNITDQTIAQIIEWKAYKIYIWLDNDNWRVVKSRNKIEKKLQSLFPDKIYMIKDKTDAKNLSDKEILDTINDII